jgi:hypothetical protein
MTAPNIVNVATITGKTAVQAVGTSATAIVTNSASSGKVLKVNALYVSNVDGTNNAEITVDLYRSSTAYHVAKTVVVPADATLDVLAKAIYLEEGDSLRLTANAASDLEAVCSYEEIS